MKSRRAQTIRDRRRRVDLAARFFLFVFFVGAIGALVVVASTRGRAWLEAFGPGSSDLSPAERLALSVYLAARAADLKAPAGADASPVSFSVLPGESAAQVSERLASLGLVRDPGLLRLYLRYQGLDQSIEAGDFVLRQTMNIPAVAAALANSSAREIAVRLTEGWRLEQIAEALGANPDLSVSPEVFVGLAGPNGPRTGGYSFLGDLPSGASFEGFLFPDTYLVRPGATAEDMLRRMLANFDARLPSGYRTAVAGHGLTLYQAVIVASLIEREAAVNDERPLIASVIFNRLVIGQPLEIDATVQYALGRPGDWWPRLGGLDLRSVASPYNTYQNAGLPAGPIANPGLASLRAVAEPADTNYLYYRALCDGSGRHAFAVTYEQHLANACQ